MVYSSCWNDERRNIVEFGIMIEIALLVLVIALFIMVIILLSKNRQGSQSQERVIQKLTDYDTRLDRNESNLRSELEMKFGQNRTDLTTSLKSISDQFSTTLANFTGLVDKKMTAMQGFLDSGLKNNREELSTSLKDFEAKSSARIESLTKDTKDGLEKSREAVDKRLAEIQQGNEKKLEEMRKTVDEKLHDTLEKRLNESFQTVSSQLQSVYKGLGEMQTLASGVGDLKKVLSNVQSRGNLGEIQLGAILELILSPEQYAKQFKIKETSNERVDYVIKLPNKNDSNKPLFLPIDSKFPNENYVRLVEAYENMADRNELETVSKQFENTVKDEAKKISSKYIDTPRTTPFALMFVPTEGLFAEIVRRTSLFESLRREQKITVVGPTNLAAFLSSLQMGFDTLAIQKRTSDVWDVLKAVNTNFRKFGEALASTKKKLISATNEIENVESKSRIIERKLNSVEKLSVPDSINLPEEIDASETEETG